MKPRVRHNSLDVFYQVLRKRGIGPGGHCAQDDEISRQFAGHYAVLVLDSSGFTCLTQDHGIIHFLSLIVDMRDQVVPIFQAHKALELWFEPDNIFGVFPLASDAVKAAIKAQKRMAELNDERIPPNRLEVCIGIGSGQLLYIPPRHIFGQEMNFACKLGEEVAGPRDILLTTAAYDEIKDNVTGLQTESCSINISNIRIDYHFIKPSASLRWLA
ncbi:hypothetical protein JXQ70_04045 [bacterium]|nr:hypothetical protein [bacterium]